MRRRLRVGASVLALAASVGVGQREGGSDLGSRWHAGESSRTGTLNRAPSRVGSNNLGRDVANRAVGDAGWARSDGIHVCRGESRSVSWSGSGSVCRRGGGVVLGGSSRADLRDNGGAAMRDAVGNSAVGKSVRGGRGLISAGSRCSGGDGLRRGGGCCRRGDVHRGVGSGGGGESWHGGGSGLASSSTIALETRWDGVSTLADRNQVCTAVLVFGDVDVLVIPVKDDISSPQESIAENGEVVILRNAKLADAQVRLLPDEILVVNTDNGIAKLEVD